MDFSQLAKEQRYSVRGVFVFSSGWVSVNDDLTSYLSDTTETRQGLTTMDEEFVTLRCAGSLRRSALSRSLLFLPH